MPSTPLEKIELDGSSSPLPETTSTPSSVLKAIVLPSLEAVPPIVLPDEPEISMPSISLPSGNCPVMSVPMRLPATSLADRPLGGPPSISMPQ